MRLTEPRITPLPPSAWNGESPLNNIGRTLLRRSEAFAAMGAWTRYVMTEGSLPPRQREIVILRIGFLCRSGYEWAQHAVMGVAAGLTPEEVERVKLGAAAADWSEADAVLIRMTDELHAGQFVSDATWVAMTRLFSEAQRMDAVFAASQYAQLSMILNTFGVQLDDGLTLDPDLEAY